jgi:Possible lysine decarboxylase
LPIIVYNFDGYYDLLLQWFAVVIKEGFTTPMSAGVLNVINRIEDLETSLATYSFVPSATHEFNDLAPTEVKQVKLTCLASDLCFASQLSIKAIPVGNC